MIPILLVMINYPPLTEFGENNTYTSCRFLQSNYASCSIMHFMIFEIICIKL